MITDAGLRMAYEFALAMASAQTNPSVRAYYEGQAQAYLDIAIAYGFTKEAA